ncbi:MAG: hypothetical protein PSW75_09765, partial [bacterium]|nr:hypothetical protein [bacterium]
FYDYNARVAIPGGFHLTVASRERVWKTPSGKASFLVAPLPLDTPLHRARAWQRRLAAESGLNRVKLAKEEGLTPGAITHHMKLLQLAPDIQEQLLNVTAPEDLRRFSLNRMKALAELSAEEQRRLFAAVQPGPSAHF